MRPRSWLLVVVTMALLPVAPLVATGARPVPVPGVSTPCDGLPDTPVPADAVLHDLGSTRFLGDVDGDGYRDVITGYRRGASDGAGAEHWIHLELASGWGAQVRIDTLDEFSIDPRAYPFGIVTMGGARLIVAGVQSNLVGMDHGLFSFHDCALAPVQLIGGGIPHLWTGIGPTHGEWFTCRENGVVEVEGYRDSDEPGQPIDGTYVGGKATFYRLDPGGFRPGVDLPLHLPRPVGQVRAEFPDCPKFLGTFVDDDRSEFQPAIEWMAYQGFTVGCNPPMSDRYCPRDPVTRGEMAAFLVRALGYTDDGGGDRFTDDDGSVFEGAIDKLAAAGVTQGCNPPTNDRFCPMRKVTREEMAAFLVRAFAYTNDGGGNHFSDDDGSMFEAAIDKLFTAGVTQGCVAYQISDQFCPEDPVTRGQLAAFLSRALN